VLILQLEKMIYEYRKIIIPKEIFKYSLCIIFQ